MCFLWTFELPGVLSLCSEDMFMIGYECA